MYHKNGDMCTVHAIQQYTTLTQFIDGEHKHKTIGYVYI